MRKLFYLLLLMVLLLAAGFFSSRLLLGFALAGLFLGVLLFTLTGYLKKHTFLRQAWTQSALPAEEDLILPFTLESNSPIQPAFCCLHVLLQYNEGPIQRIKIHTPCQKAPRLSLQGCGLVQLTLDFVKLYDWTGLFCRKLSCPNALAQIVLLPKEKPVFIDIVSEYTENEGTQKQPSLALSGENAWDIKDIRNWQPQDSLRLVHWIQSARMESLYVKEYEKETTGALTIHIQMESGSPTQKAEDLQFIYSVLYGFLVRAVPLTCIITQKTKTCTFSIADVSSLKKMWIDLMLDQTTGTLLTMPIHADLYITGHQKIQDARHRTLIWK